MNVNWTRWIFASISRHFSDMLTPMTLFIEGQHRNTAGLKDFLELRTEGPDYYRVSHDSYNIEIVVSILAQSLMDDVSYHRLYETLGLVQDSFISISVYRFGSSSVDDQSYIGCLVLQEPMITRHLGQVGPRTNLVQSFVQGTYRMSLKDN